MVGGEKTKTTLLSLGSGYTRDGHDVASGQPQNEKALVGTRNNRGTWLPHCLQGHNSAE